jgi:hypothetical protein
VRSIHSLGSIVAFHVLIFRLHARPFGREVAFACLADFFCIDGSERCALKLQIKTHDIANNCFRRVGRIVEASHPALTIW